MSASKTKASIPYCFSSNAKAAAAEVAVNQKYDNMNAYATARTLFVPEPKSMLIRLGIEEFIRSLGGKRHTD